MVNEELLKVVAAKLEARIRFLAEQPKEGASCFEAAQKRAQGRIGRQEAVGNVVYVGRVTGTR